MAQPGSIRQAQAGDSLVVIRMSSNCADDVERGNER
jgi:hypothetical protein